MKRRVKIESSFSELVIVKDQYDVYFEKHLRVPNRNFSRVGLGGFKPLLLDSIEKFFCAFKVSILTNQGGTAEVTFRPYKYKAKGFFIYNRKIELLCYI